MSNADRIYALEIKSPEELDKSLNELWAIYDTNSDGKLSTYECSKLTNDCISASLIKMDQVLHPSTHLPRRCHCTHQCTAPANAPLIKMDHR